MGGKYLLGAAGAALLTVAWAGTAGAADVNAVVVPVVAPVAVAVPGPIFAVRIDQALVFDRYLFGGNDLSAVTELTARVTLPSGWGFELLKGSRTYITPPVEVVGSLTGRVFHHRGAVEVGIYGGFGYFIPGGLAGYGFGGDFRLDNDRITVESYAHATFGGGVFQFFETGAEATFHANDRLDLVFGGELGVGPLEVDVWAAAQYDFGVFAPYAGIWYGTFSGAGAELGIEIEKQIGNGPFSLIGDAEINVTFGGGLSAEARVGIRFQRGELPD